MEQSEEILISLIVCTRNEERFIDKCLESLISQKGIEDNFEILIIDGMSDDDTINKIEFIINQHKNIRFFQNKLKVKPPAINIGFKNARGKFIAICDAHTYYNKDYISTLLQLMNEYPDVQCVGGPITSIGENHFGEATAIAMSSFIGVGNAMHRMPEFEGYAEMACFPLFRREVLDMIGYYDERFIINHDDEYCLRLRLAGGRIYLSPKAKSYYFVRNSPIKLFKQYFSYAFWHWATIKKHRRAIAIRQTVPSIFILTILGLLMIGTFLKSPILALILPGIYILTLLIFSLKYLFTKKIIIGLIFPISIIILHLSYGLGFIFGFFHFRTTNFKE